MRGRKARKRANWVFECLDHVVDPRQVAHLAFGTQLPRELQSLNSRWHVRQQGASHAAGSVISKLYFSHDKSLEIGRFHHDHRRRLTRHLLYPSSCPSVAGLQLELCDWKRTEES